MTYLLYMKRSFTRSSRRHAVLFAVLTCAFLLPLLISIYRDSKPTPAENDSRQENEKRRSNGHHCPHERLDCARKRKGILLPPEGLNHG